ncbi:unnamed protein product [Staurois parvus]|uniref:Uncharacterized protein n=1 Tax=Staurois parvus TaxID=386267 RepID=A0ABN9E006_9NEOB|nr:unnamed protein product [Staurois parvus]
MRTGHKGCHAERHYRSREDSARLDRGTGKMKGTTPRKWERVPVKFRYPLPLPPQRSAVITCTVRSLWS